VYNLAHELGLSGLVYNDADAVMVDVEGEPAAIERLESLIRSSPPRLASVASVSSESAPLRGYEGFEIAPSASSGRAGVLVPPDVATCDDCRREVFDPSDRHYRYPFTNCTACGPRFTIIRGLPYDRRMTSMDAFEMCVECRSEYEDPEDRRFHAQPVACPRCGPSVTMVDRSGRALDGDPFERFRRLIAGGRIVAVKGIGGFHLACDAANEAAVRLLRERKRRPAKPFAVMAADLETVAAYCLVDGEEEALLASPEAPIVLLRRKKSPGGVPPLAESVAPGMSTLGVMLPYTPLHMLLFDRELRLLVMTSGNPSDLPLVVSNEEALERLSAFADAFLVHDREIVNRCDDSVVEVLRGEAHFHRRSRGCVPAPIAVPAPLREAGAGGDRGEAGSGALGLGGEMKNAVCVVRGGEAFTSQHVGEADTAEGLTASRRAAEHLLRLLGVRPVAVGYDPHPLYEVSGLRHGYGDARHFAVQHHHAHMCACMAENLLEGPCMGLVLDGTGYGTDGTAWGCEILYGDYVGFERIGHLANVPLPGGEAAVRHPWMMAVAHLVNAMGVSKGTDAARALLGREDAEIRLVLRVLERGVNSPLTSSAARARRRSSSAR